MIFRPLAGAGAGKSLPGEMDNAVHPLRAARPSGVATQLQRKIPEAFQGFFYAAPAQRPVFAPGSWLDNIQSTQPFSTMPGSGSKPVPQREVLPHTWQTQAARTVFHGAAGPLQKIPAPRRRYTPYSLSLRHRDERLMPSMSAARVRLSPASSRARRMCCFSISASETSGLSCP